MNIEERIKFDGVSRTARGAYRAAVCAALPALALLAAGLSLVGCGKDSSSWWGPSSREVEATLSSLAVADAVVVEPMGSRALTADAPADGVAYGSPDGMADDNGGLFTVGLGPAVGMTGGAASGGTLSHSPEFGAADGVPSTRADVALSNVWVLQFDAAGATRACAWVGTVAAGQKVKAALQSGENYTVWIVANGPAEGVLTTSNPATLSDFEGKMLHTATPASDELIPLSGKLTNVKVLDNGQVLVGSDNTVVPQVTLTRAMARVDVLLEYNVSGAELDGVWLYQVPVGACYGLGDEATEFPASGEVSNFSYRNGESAGLAPKSSGSGTVTHTWYVGDNRRGQNAAIQWEKNKGKDNAPAMATYARIKSHESSDATKGLYHDVYLGENVTTDFDMKRNRHYIYRVRIGGTLEAQKLLAQRDDRVWAGSLEYLDGAPTVEPALSLTIHKDGQTFKVTFNGYWTGAGIPVRATVVGGEELVSGTAACQAGNTGSVTLEIPKNDGAERQIEFAYEWKGEWNVIGIGTQAEDSPIGELYGGGVVYWVDPADENNFRVVALDQGSSLKWAASTSYALGSGAQSESARNGAAIMTLAKQYSANHSGGASGDFATDFPAFAYCYNYQGPNNTDPVGTWYLPSKQELTDLYAAKGSVESVIIAKGGTAFSADYYWSASEDSNESRSGWSVYFSDGDTNYGDRPKSNSLSVRCVRGQ